MILSGTQIWTPKGKECGVHTEQAQGKGPAQQDEREPERGQEAPGMRPPPEKREVKEASRGSEAQAAGSHAGLGADPGPPLTRL